MHTIPMALLPKENNVQMVSSKIKGLARKRSYFSVSAREKLFQLSSRGNVNELQNKITEM
jgi:transcriptional regulator with GAF, ATPase, and Fis domain